MDEIILNTMQMCKLFQCSRPTLGEMHRAGLPKAGRGKWGLFDCFNWYIENIADFDRSTKETGELTKIKTELYSVRSEREAFELAVKKKKYLSVEEVSQNWAKRIIAVVSGLETLADRLPAVLEGKTKQQMYQTIRSEIRALRNAYAQEGKYTPSKRVLSILEPCLRRLKDIYDDDDGRDELKN